MRIKPHLTEKSLSQAKNGKYTFIVDPHLSKMDAKKIIEEVFGVHVVDVATIQIRKIESKDNRGNKKTKKAAKKVIVKLKDKEKIDLFEEKVKK